MPALLLFLAISCYGERFASPACANRCGTLGYVGAFERGTTCLCGTPAPGVSVVFDVNAARVSYADATCALSCGKSGHPDELETSVQDSSYRWACWCLDPAPVGIDPEKISD